MASVILPRGFRNNNPLNIRKGSSWKGLSPNQGDKSFCVFTSMRYGIRAAIYLLLKYYKIYKCHTIYDIISRWAPQCENDTFTYCRIVANELDVPFMYIVSLDLDLLHSRDTLYNLLCAMILVENGRHLYVDKDMFFDIIENEIPVSLK